MSYTLNKTGVQIDAILDRAETGGQIDQDIALKAPLNSPALTGTPTAPTPAEGDSSTKIATTEFVAAAAAGLITDTAGPDDVVTIPDGSDAEMLSFKATILPVQDLNGYSNPWPSGGGKNLLETTGTTSTIHDITFTVNADGSVSTSGTSNDSTIFVVNANIPLEASTTYKIGGIPNNSTAYKIILRADGTWVKEITTKNGDTYTTDASAHTYDIVIRFDNGVNSNGLVFKPFISKDATVTYDTWAPYSNICPISGRTGAEAVVGGVNLVDLDNQSSSYSAGGKVFLQVGTYYACRFSASSQLNTYAVYSTSENGTYIQVPTDDSNEYIKNDVAMQWSTPRCVITVKKACWVAFNCYPNAGSTPYSVMLATDNSAYNAVGTSSRPVGGDIYNQYYKPYNGTTYPITWTDEAGTVFGGTIDLVSGVLTVTSQLYTYSGAGYNVQNHSSGNVYIALAGQSLFVPNSADFATNIAKNNMNVPNVQGNLCSNGSAGVYFSHNDAFQDAAGFIAYATANPVQMLMPLATPQTYQLDPVAVRSLLGVNNCWTDTGETEIEYKADLKLYIDKKIAEAL